MLRYQTAIKQCENSKLAIDAVSVLPPLVFPTVSIPSSLTALEASSLQLQNVAYSRIVCAVRICLRWTVEYAVSDQDRSAVWFAACVIVFVTVCLSWLLHYSRILFAAAVVVAMRRRKLQAAWKRPVYVLLELRQFAFTNGRKEVRCSL